MSNPTCKRLLAALAGLVLATLQTWSQAGDRIRFNGQDLFLNGLNLAWSSFANDIGPNPATPNLAHFENVFLQMNGSGANAMRLWLHTTGAHTPAWNGPLVTGPGQDTISDLRAILDLAWQYDCGLILCLWSFDMLRISNGTGVTDRAMAILTQPANRQSYVDNALVPMVEALAGHPAIIAWEIFNEPEGMSTEHGWSFNRHVPMAAIQAFVNVCAGAIHRADPAALVSNGSWAFIATSDVGAGNFNYYTDQRLVAAGGDPDGTLDFYMVHYYDWAGTGLSPFHRPASYWGLDKPLVVAEFYPECANCGADSYATLYENGYAGALGWSWTDVSPASLLAQSADVSGRHPEDILVIQSGRPSVALTAPAPGTWYAEGVPIRLEAEAADADGSVERVVFHIDGQAVGEDNAPPFALDLDGRTTGTYALHATAIDNTGLRRRSGTVTVKVGRPELVVRFEAEAAHYTGVVLRSELGASGGAYLDMRGEGSILWTIPDVPAAGTYELAIGYNLNYGSPKTNFLSVNGGANTAVVFSGSVGGWARKTLQVALAEGTNTLRISPSWGWMYFDFLVFDALYEPGAPAIELGIRTAGPGARVSVYAPPGIAYELLFSADLGAWTVLESFTPPVMPAQLTDSAHDGQAARFYSVRPAPGR